MDILEYDHRVHFDPEADKNLAVRFYMGTLRNEEKSLAEKRPIYDDVEFIEIRVRGDRNNIQQRPVREGDAERFRAAYREFKMGETQAQSGTPLKEWPAMTLSMIEELKHLGFYTVDQLANASDSVCAKFAGLQSYKQRAKAFIEMTKGLPAVDKLSAELEEERNKREVAERNVEELKAAVERLSAQVEVLSKAAGKK